MNLVFRKMTDQDLEMVMKWRMQDDVTRFMATNPKLTIESQKQWFEKQKQNPNSYFWIIEIDSISAGVVSIQMNEDGKQGETSSYIAVKECKSMPNMVSVIASLLDYYFDVLNAEILYGEVFKENKAVVMINKHLGYTIEGIEAGEVEKEGAKYDVIKLSMSKENWYIRRNQIKYTNAKIKNFIDDEISKNVVNRIEKRTNIMRQDILKMAMAAGTSGLHFGGTLSLVEIIASLYFYNMNFSSENYMTAERDRLILSKGHGVPAIYAALKQLEIISDEDLLTFKNDVTDLYGHPSMNAKLGIEFSSGSLGQGLSLAVGNAIALKKKMSSSRIFVILGDGECNEGAVWEAATSAVHYKLNNIMVIVDRNHLQYDGNTETIMAMGQLEDKFRTFGWETYVTDGHDIESCCKAFNKTSDKPIAIIADTIKGKGISFMENQPKWHHNILSEQQYEKALGELNNV